ncbi:MAG: helix-turn-helix transcriptional regulator [Anaerolineae bacterium]|nr:helix-turn-helix transcriptional regulator [Anaerolineae bacterium]
MAVVSHITFNDEPSSALGQVIVAGIIRDSPGIAPTKPLRVLNHYALVYISDGGGYFKDTLGCEHRIVKGDLLFLFPGIGHTYGPSEEEFWYEIFIVFEGSIFDLWRNQGLLDPRRPVLHLEPVDYWFKQFHDTIWSVPQSGAEYGLIRVCHLQQLLAQILAHHQQEGEDKVDQLWLSEAKTLLTAHFNKPPDYKAIASSLGMSYDGFRKRFTRETGVSPARYHTLRRMDRACEQLLNEDLAVKEIAHQLGFSDEYHFSKRFKQVIGMSPTGFRTLFGSW